MPIASENFGVSIINLTGNDTFFLDTNFVVASTDMGNKFHKACKGLLYFFVEKDVKLYITNIVIIEAMHALARAIYIDEELQKINPNHTLSIREIKMHTSRLKSSWGNFGKHGAHLEELKKFNEEAKALLMPFLELTNVEYVDITEDIVLEGLDIGINYSLHSADATLVSVAKKLEVKGLISLDGDMGRSPLNVYTTDTDNIHYNKSMYETEDSDA